MEKTYREFSFSFYNISGNFPVHQKRWFLPGTFALWNFLLQVGRVAKSVYELWNSGKLLKSFKYKETLSDSGSTLAEVSENLEITGRN